MNRKKTSRKRKNPHLGSRFEDYLLAQGALEEATALAVKRVLAWELSEAMRKAGVSQAELARRMHTSRAVIHRLLDEKDPSVTLATISRAVTALGCHLSVKIAA